ncbi:voltage-dependent calcium channel subunit alpha-2/delta-3 isoform X2 [Camponotus floridanus]|uniref:voltage-dependent calcium channel subunit alpha-2/delta-3 isoform X2 n=1 Tax=Camponotus floridanus TaxID=104421 RepID=UPI00059CDB30|nr:voltage-dependent calcium channel subunit alpha-2/delta-3 isoform X2 [Camponotus floridanus]
MRPCFIPIVIVLILIEAPDRSDSISINTVKTWGEKLSFELSQLAKYVTKVEKFQENYKSTTVAPRDGAALVIEIAKDIKRMMESKISAIKRIMDTAEQSALSSMDVDPPESYKFINAKNNSIELEYSAHFGGNVNTTKSTVHVPTNVYERASDVIRAIEWSEKLDPIFVDNYNRDPSLSWQYFGSASGFMRQYPAMSWYMDPVDLFDCRTRSWYIEAATSPKDILILMDTSGSMTGMRREIARHVINNILDTLGNNDFVNIITFSNVTKEVVPCFSDTLVQANLANVRELKLAIEKLVTEKIANFSLALTTAFELLETFRTEREGAKCNQAIMLITDGVPYNFKEIFEAYNWKDNPDEPLKADMPVRVFTYLIGREVADVREVQWMACANRGYYVHLCTPAEVREEVLKYVPVMARPLVLGRTDHPTIWTPVYADITDPKMTDWYWEQRENQDQKDRFLFHKSLQNKKVANMEYYQDRRFVKNEKRGHDQTNGWQEYKLMTSVSMPVFDQRENATMIANLLGVAGTDVPIDEIQKLMMPHMLGVNGYAFIVTNNGFILIHPDLRPVFKGILKPAYNSVDMAEVELMDSDRGPREFDEGIIMLRNDVVNQTNGSVTLHTKYHYDDMKRVGRVKRKYDYMGITDTPFTVVVSLPEYEHTGSYRVHDIEEIHRSHAKEKYFWRVEDDYRVDFNKQNATSHKLFGKNVTDYFAGSNWRVHPDWMYCKYHYEGEHKFNTSEMQLLHFLERARQPGWKWIESKWRSQPPEKSASASSHNSHTNPSKTDKNSYYCDRNLLLSLVYDAKMTEWFTQQSIVTSNHDESGKDFKQRFGVILAFVATRSGLTRWQDLEEDVPLPNDHFSKLYPRAIDEVWYKRAVEQYYVNPDNFVFSIPIDEEGVDNTTLVTVSRAIFIGQEEKKKAPVAVVGFQFQQTVLQSYLQNITFSCGESTNCYKHCGDDAWTCYLIDNNGYIVAAKDETDTGKFFGEVRGSIMISLVKEGVFERIKIFDYQAVCFKNTQSNNAGNELFTPWKHLRKTLSWLISQAAWLWAKTGILEPDYAGAYGYANDEETVHDDHDDHENQEKSSADSKDERTINQDSVLINRTRLEVCDQEVDLYLRNTSFDMYDVGADECIRPYMIQPLNLTNLLLVVVNIGCGDTASSILSITPEEVAYGNNTLVCQKAIMNLKRKRPQSCIRTHLRESEIKDQCGLATNIRSNLCLLVLTLLLTCALAKKRVVLL